jgi:MYXO-CTERM domain-containing protein
MSSSTMTLRRRWFAALCALIVLAIPLVAGAAGRVQWASKAFKERDGGSWRLEIAIFLNKAPDTPNMPVKFEFEPTAYYERAMLDGDKLVERKVPLTGRQALIESVDIGFMDPGSGKIEKRTKFTFKLTRAHGYEAGEYKVTIRDGRSGGMIGTPTTLSLEGENEVIDRRAMVFAAGAPKKKKEEMKQVDKEGNVKEGGEGESKEGAEGAEGGEGSEGGEGGEAAEGEGSEPAAAEGEGASEGGDDSPPGEIKEKPGGCGCKVGERQSSHSALGLLALLGLALLRRRAA